MTEFEQISKNMLSDAELADENIFNNTGLSAEQVYDLLSEIETEDEELASAEYAFIPSIDCDIEECGNKAIIEENFIKQDYISSKDTSWFDNAENNVNYTEGEYVYRKPEDEKNTITKVSDAIDRAQKIKNVDARFFYERKLRKIEINRMAFDQDVIRLADTFTVEHKRLLIKLLTNRYHYLINKYEAYIIRRITRLLRPAIPLGVKAAYRKWPWIFVQNPGFMYKTHLSDELYNFGDIKTFWVDTKLPYYFKQGTEQAILEEVCNELQGYIIHRLDRAVHMYYKSKEMLAKREVQYAARLLKLDGTTVSMGSKKPRGSENSYYSLLQLDPFWFEILYKELKKQKEDELL